MTTKNLMQLGLINMRQQPTRLTCNLVTYKHPTVLGLTVTVHPMPTVAGGSFWHNYWYGQHASFDRVLMEDDGLPARVGTMEGNKALLLRAAFPFTGQRNVVTNDIDFGKYDQAQAWRDRYDGTLAYTSVIELKDPPVDPRSRRAVDHLNTIADGMKEANIDGTAHRVVMPWNMYHCYYLNWRFRQEGWTVEKTQEVEMINRWEVTIVMIFVAFSMSVSIYLTFKMFKYLIFGY